MGSAGGGLIKPDRVARPPRRAEPHPLLTILLCTLGVTALAGVVVAAALGQTTAALVIGLVSAAFFAGILC